MQNFNIISIINQTFINIKDFIKNKVIKNCKLRENEKNKLNIYLQCTYLSLSILSTLCVINNFQLINCSNTVGIMCLFDFLYIKRTDMILHHIFVLLMIDYMNNNYYNIPISGNIISIILSTEISTIFLITNSLLSNDYIIKDYLKINTYFINIIKNMNNILFISTFLYYRVYNYYFNLIIDKDTNISFFRYTKNVYRFYEIYISIYGLFLLNLYWTTLIFIKFCPFLDYSKLYIIYKKNF